MKLACADFTWPLLAHEDVLRLIRSLGLDGLDLGLFAERSHIRPEVIRADIPMWAGVLRERIRRADLELADVFVQNALDFETMAPNNPDPREREAGMALFLDMLASKVAGRFRILLLVPYMIPGVVAALVWINLYSPDVGPLTPLGKEGYLIRSLSLGGHPVTVIAAKLDQLLRVSTDIKLLDYARDEMVSAANQGVHRAVVQNLRFGTTQRLNALKRAGVATELHVYANTTHGFGVRASDRPHSTWTKACEAWLRNQGLLK